MVLVTTVNERIVPSWFGATPLAVAAVLVVLLTGWAIDEMRRARVLGRQEVEDSADAVADTLSASLTTLIAQEPLPTERMQELLAGIVATTEVQFLRVAEYGAVLAEAGLVPRLPEAPIPSGGCFVGGLYVHFERLRLPADPFALRKREAQVPDADDTNLSTSDVAQWLVVGVSDEFYRAHVRDAAQRTATTAVIGLLAIVVMTTTWILTLRNRELRQRVSRLRMRETHLVEMNHAAAGLAHETKNPLGLIRGLAQHMAKHPDDPKATRHAAEAIMDQADTASSRISGFLGFASAHVIDPKQLDGATLMQRAAELLQEDFASEDVGLKLVVSPIRIVADSERLLQVLVNLLLNSLQACERGGHVIVTLGQEEGGSAIIEVSDDGRGIPTSIRDRIFQPYVTGRTGGHGLGLAIVNRIVGQHGWSIDVRSPLTPATGRGTAFRISGIGSEVAR